MNLRSANEERFIYLRCKYCVSCFQFLQSQRKVNIPVNKELVSSWQRPGFKFCYNVANMFMAKKGTKPITVLKYKRTSHN